MQLMIMFKIYISTVRTLYYTDTTVRYYTLIETTNSSTVCGFDKGIIPYCSISYRT